MSKSLKILFIITIMLMLILPNFLQATSIDMNLTNTLNSNTNTNEINNNLANTSNTSNQITNANDNTNIPSNPQTVIQSSSTSSLSNLPEANLGLSNILSIILIVIGVLLILLAIAILIRLKH